MIVSLLLDNADLSREFGLLVLQHQRSMASRFMNEMCRMCMEFSSKPILGMGCITAVISLNRKSENSISIITEYRISMNVNI